MGRNNQDFHDRSWEKEVNDQINMANADFQKRKKEFEETSGGEKYEDSALLNDEGPERDSSDDYRNR